MQENYLNIIEYKNLAEYYSVCLDKNPNSKKNIELRDKLD